MMQTSVERVDGAVPVTVVAVSGELDASNFQELIAAVRGLRDEGTSRLVLDLAGLTYMASSGLVALHSIAMLLRGQEPPDPEAGWGAFHTLGLDVTSGGRDPNVRLAGVQPPVRRVLERTGLDQLFEIHADRDAAVASF